MPTADAHFPSPSCCWICFLAFCDVTAFSTTCPICDDPSVTVRAFNHAVHRGEEKTKQSKERAWRG